MNNQEVLEYITKFIRDLENDKLLREFNAFLSRNTDTYDPFFIDEDVQLTDEDINELFQEFMNNR